MTEEEIKAQETQQQPTTAETPSAAPAVPEAGTEPAGTPSPSARDAFRSEYTGKYPGEDLTDDEAYVNHVRGKLDERDGYEKAFNNMTDALGKSELFNEMLEAAKNNPDFDPVVWAVENDKLDLEALQSDPDYAKKLAEAQQKALASKSKMKEMKDEAAQNFQPSVDLINRVAEEMGLSEDEKLQALGNMYRIMNDLVVDKVDEDMFRMVASGMRHDADTENARAEGYAQGMAKKVDDKLRKMPQQSERNGGRQMARPEEQPAAKQESNMFGV